MHVAISHFRVQTPCVVMLACTVTLKDGVLSNCSQLNITAMSLMLPYLKAFGSDTGY